MKSEGEEGESMFDSIIDLFFMPVTISIGVLGNSLSIVVLRNKEIQLRDSFARILIALAVFDLTLILSSACIFTIPCFSDTYAKLLYPHIVPFFLPAAQIAMTASVYTTVITCFDRYIAICRPALLGCCGRSEQKTSWCLICGTAIFSIVYNFTRFFEFRPELTIDPSTNLTVFSVEQTALRKDPLYIQWYILIANFVFMGVFPSIIMIVFNLLVVRAVNEANKKRARMTKRQQRNITVTSMLVSVVVFFLICHSVKFIVTLYEIWESVISPEENWPPWVQFLTKLSHWLLILNSSSNIAIYVHKDPKFKAVFKNILFTYFNKIKTCCVSLRILQKKTPSEDNNSMIEFDNNKNIKNDGQHDLIEPNYVHVEVVQEDKRSCEELCNQSQKEMKSFDV